MELSKLKFDHTCKCGKEFKHVRKHKKYCSLKCAHKFKPFRSDNDYKRNYKYIQNYGITLDDYNILFIEQNGCCKICTKHQNEFKMKLSVDHNHSTGEIRGLLCQKCNHGIGLFNEDKTIIKAVLEYLK